MQDRPNPAELLEAVAAFLRDKVIPASNDALAFHARVAANALDIARRELLSVSNAQAATDERDALQLLLGEHDAGSADLDTLNRALCQRIAAGELTLATPGLARHLWRITRDKLAVDQPGYGTYRRSLEHQHHLIDPDAALKGTPVP